MLKDNPIIMELLSLKLPPEHYAVFGSGPMSAHGLKELEHDVDLIARGPAWQKAIELGSPDDTIMHTGTGVVLKDGLIEIFNCWAPGEWSIDQLIDEAEIIEGIRFVRLEEVRKWKTLYGRDKDKEHVRLIDSYLEDNKVN